MTVQERPPARPATAAGSAGFAPLRVLNNPLLGRYALTMCCIQRNGLFYLDAFLEHYRRLGVDRFVVLDDRSGDGSYEHLAAQPDVMIVGSDLHYSQTLEYPPEALAQLVETRAVRLWRDQLMNQFCVGQWALVADTDEFLCLPEGTTARDLVARLERDGTEAVWGSMIDMYPARASSLVDPAATARFAPDAAWYFDGREHIRPRDPMSIPRGVYPGCRARLFAEFGLTSQGSLLRRVRRRLSGTRYAPHGLNYKVPLLRWREGDLFRNCHSLNKPVSTRYVLPIMHFKFTSELWRKIDFAVSTGGYSRGSLSYKLYKGLLERMLAEDAAFLCPISVRYRGYADFERTGIARL